jgi:hypothetical protein
MVRWPTRPFLSTASEEEEEEEEGPKGLLGVAVICSSRPARERRRTRSSAISGPRQVVSNSITQGKQARAEHVRAHVVHQVIDDVIHVLLLTARELHGSVSDLDRLRRLGRERTDPACKLLRLVPLEHDRFLLCPNTHVVSDLADSSPWIQVLRPYRAAIPSGASLVKALAYQNGLALRASPLLGRVGRSRRREVGEQVGRVHLEEIHGLRQAAKPPGAKASEADPLSE